MEGYGQGLPIGRPVRVDQQLRRPIDVGRVGNLPDPGKLLKARTLRDELHKPALDIIAGHVVGNLGSQRAQSTPFQ